MPYELFHEHTMQPRHFGSAGMSKALLAQYRRMLAIGHQDDPGKWRSFSPVEVLALLTMRVLKKQTGLVLKRQDRLIEFTKDWDAFTWPVASIAVKHGHPVLLTDLRGDARVIDAHDTGASVIDMVHSHGSCMTLDMLPCVYELFTSMFRGGSNPQRKWVDDLSLDLFYDEPLYYLADYDEED